jgi:hypothetical protein
LTLTQQWITVLRALWKRRVDRLGARDNQARFNTLRRKWFLIDLPALWRAGWTISVRTVAAAIAASMNSPLCKGLIALRVTNFDAE